MALLTKFYTVSTLEKARQAIKLGYLQYPGICFVGTNSKTKSIVWMTKNNEMEYIVGNGQITDVKYVNNVLTFYHNDDILYTIPIGLSEDVIENIVATIKQEFHLDAYAKTAEVVQLLDDKIGDTGEKTVTEYVADKMNDSPIIKKTGTLFAAVVLNELSTGLYSVTGQYKYGGLLQTIHTANGGELFYVEQTDSGALIAKCVGSEFRLYSIYTNGSYVTDKYVTESWLKAQDYIKRNEAEEIIGDIVTNTVEQKVDEAITNQFDRKLDTALNSKVGAIPNEEIHDIFHA